MGPAERSLPRVAEQAGLSESWIERWSSSFHWSRRADAWDRQQARRLAAEFEEQQKQAIKLEVQQWATTREDREQKFLQRKDQTREDFFAAAKSMVDFPLATITVKDGVTIVKPRGWSMLTAGQYFLDAYKLSGQAIRGDCAPCCNVVLRDVPPRTDFDANPTTPARYAEESPGGDPPWLPLRPKQGKGGATETALNYEAFRLYYTARVDRRSLRQVALQVHKSPKLLERWSSAFHWNQRAEAWDRHLEELRQEVQEAPEQEVAQNRAERLEQRREEIYQLSEKMEAVANNMLQYPLETITIKDSDGRVVRIIEPPRWRIVMGARMEVMAFDLWGMAIRHDDVPLPANPQSGVSVGTAPWLQLLPRQGKDGATETARNYAAFRIYYRMGADERRLGRVAQQLGKSEKLMEHWSSRFHWWERATAWDDHLTRQQQEALASQSREKWAARRAERRERAYRNSQKLSQKGIAISDSPLVKVTTEEVDGCTVRTITPNKISKADAVTLSKFWDELTGQACRNE